MIMSEELQMPRFQLLRERFLSQNTTIHHQQQLEQQSPNYVEVEESNIDIDNSLQAQNERRKDKKNKRKQFRKPISSQRSVTAVNNSACTDQNLDESADMNTSMNSKSDGDTTTESTSGLQYDMKRKELKESIELLKMKLQSYNEVTDQTVSISTPLEVDNSNTVIANVEMNIVRKNQLALQKLKKRSIFNKVEKAKSLVHCSVLEKCGIDIRSDILNIEEEIVNSLKNDDCASLLRAEAMYVRVLMQRFRLDCSQEDDFGTFHENSSHINNSRAGTVATSHLEESSHTSTHGNTDSAVDGMALEDILYFLERTARSNVPRESFSLDSDTDISSNNASHSSGALNGLLSSAVSGVAEKDAPSTADVGCADILMSVVTAVNMILCSHSQQLQLSCGQLKEAVRNRDHSLFFLQQSLDDSVHQVNSLQHRILQVEQSLAYHRGVADQLEELQSRLSDSEQLRRTAEEALRVKTEQLAQQLNNNSWRQPFAPRDPFGGGRMTGYRDVLGGSDSDSDEVLHSESRFLVHRDHHHSNHYINNRGSISSNLHHSRLHSTSLCQSVRSLNTNSNANRNEVSLSVAALVSQLAELTVADWTNLYISSPQQLDERSFAFSELASVSTDLEAVLSKLKAAKEEMTRQQQQLEDTHNNSSGSNVCCICLDAPKSILVMPCRHLCVCVGCSRGGSGSAARPLRLCPVCRTHVTECLQVYS